MSHIDMLENRQNCLDKATHFDQFRFRGAASHPAFDAEPLTNGVAERFNRKVKEQAIHSRIFCNLEGVRQAACEFVARYNAH